MKQFNVFFKIFFLTLIYSCRKSELKTSSIASLMLVNAVPGGKSIMLGSNRTAVANNASLYFPILSGKSEIYVWPVGDSVNPYFNNSKSLDLENGDIFSLYLTGSTTKPEALLIKESIPYRIDSTAGIRFINLSPNSPSLKITLSRTPLVNEVSSLDYKQITDFKSYPASSSSPLDTFQVRNATTGAIITTIPFNTSSNVRPRFSNITLVIRGLVGSTPAIGFTRVNNDR